MASKTLYIGVAVVVALLAIIATLFATQQPSKAPTATSPTATQTTSSPTTTAPKKTVAIGALLPLTGDLQTYGIGAKNAVELAVEDANKACQNIQFTLYVEDTATDPQQALSRLQTLYARGVRFIVGPMSSGEVKNIKSFADSNKIIIFSPSSTSPQLAIAGDWVYRIVPTDEAQAKAIVDLLKQLGIQRLVIIYRNDAWGVGLKDAITREAKSLNISIVATENYNPDVREYPTAIPNAIRKLSNALGSPEKAAIVFVVFENDGLVAIQEASRDPVLSKVRWIGTDGIAFSNTLIGQVGKEMASAKMLGTVTAPDPNDPMYKSFVERYKAKFGKDPVAYDPYSYDAAMILMKIICELGTDNPDSVKAALEQWGKEGRYKGVTGTVYLNEYGDRAYPNYLIYGVVTDGGKPKYINAAYYTGADRKITIYPEGQQLFK